MHKVFLIVVLATIGFSSLHASEKVVFSESFEKPLLNTTNFPSYNGKWVNYGVPTEGFDTGADAPVATSFVGDSGLEWAVTLGNVDLVGSSNFQAADGSQSINLNGFEQGALEASVVFPAPGNYTLVFALSKNPTGVDEAKVEVSIDSVELAGSPFSFDSAVTADAMNYRYVSISFGVVTAGAHTLKFKSLNAGSPNGFGPVIDDISVSREVIFSESFEKPLLNTTNFPSYNGKWVNYGVPTEGFDTGADAPVATSFVGDSGLEWAVTLGNVDLVGSSNFQAADGSQSINLNGFEQGALEASVVFPAPGNYTLVFALSKNPTGVDEAKVEVSIDSVELAGSPFSFDSAVTADAMNYRYVSISFGVVTAGAHTLKFKSLNAGSPNGFGPVIDDISVSREVIFSESFEKPLLNTTNFPSYNGKWVNYGVPTEGFDTGADAPVATSFVGDSGLEWAVTLGNVDLVGSSNFQAADGSQSINLNGFEQGALEASVVFPAPGNYTLVFALSKNPTGVDEAKVEVSIDSVELAGSPFSFDSAVTADAMNYRYVSISFGVVTAGAHTLKFKSLNAGSPNGFGPVIDDISVSREVIFSESFEKPLLNTTNFPSYNGKWVNYGVPTEGFDTGADAPVATSFVGDSGLEWAVTLGNVDLVGSSNFQAADGSQSINLNGFEQGALEASVVFPAPGNYTLVFALSKNPTGVDEAKVEVSIDSVELAGSPFSFDSAVTADAMNYRYVSISFGVVTAGAHTLKFKSLNAGSPNGFGPVIDDLVVSKFGTIAALDSDLDGYPNYRDSFRLDSSEALDTDSDGRGNNDDDDDDNDGVLDTADAYSLISLGSLTDTDGDGRPNDCDSDCQTLGMAADTDDDGDGVADSSDAFPLDAAESTDTDSDGTGDRADADDDGDGIADSADAFPLISLGGRTDTDSDGYPDDCDDNCVSGGMLADADDDNDGVVDADDAFPLDASKSTDEVSGSFSFDIDGNAEAQPLTDGLLVIRHLFGFSGDSLISGAVSGEAGRDSSDAIASYLTDADSQLDIDGDGESKPLTDGLLLIRYLFGFSGDSLISGAIGDGAERDTAEEVEVYIKGRSSS